MGVPSHRWTAVSAVYIGFVVLVELSTQNFLKLSSLSIINSVHF